MIRDGTGFTEVALETWLIAPGPPPEGQWSGESARRLAWALKTRCYALWSSEPAKAVEVAHATARLAQAAKPHLDAASNQEINALAHWLRGIACAIQGDMQAATRELDAARDDFQALGQRHPAAQTQVPKVMALAMMGQRQAATQCALAAQHELLACGDHATAAKVLLNLGNLCLRADLFTVAKEHFRQASELFTRTGNTEHAAMATLGLADTLAATGQIGPAEQLYLSTFAAAEQHGHAVLQAIAGESLALLDLLRGRYASALAGLKTCMDRYHALGMPQQLAIAEKQLGDAYLQLRLLPECLRTYIAAQARFDELDMQVDGAWVSLQQARALAQLGRPTAAAQAFEQARARFARCEQPGGTAAVDLACAEQALTQGEPAQAAALAMAAGQYFRAQSWVEFELQAQAVQAQALLQQGQAVKAGEKFAATLTRALHQHLPPAQLRCLTGRGLASLAAGQHAAAMADLQQAGELLEDQRRTLPGDEIRSAFQNQHQALSQGMLQLTLEAHAVGEVEGAEVLRRLDVTRARTLVDHLDHSDLLAGTEASQPGASAAESPEIARLRSQLAWLYRRLRDNDDRASVSDVLVAQLRQLEDELLEQSRRQRLAAAAGDQGHTHAQWDVASLQRALGEDEALVAFGVVDDELFACVTTRHKVRVCRAIASWAQVQDTIRAVRFQIEALCHGNTPLRRHLPTMASRTQGHLRQLHHQLWAPLQPHLGAARQVLLVPQGMLSMVPFAALHDGDGYLADRLRFSVVPSARLALRVLTQAPRPMETVLALADTQRLGHAAREVAQLQGLLPGLQAFQGGEATVANLRRHGPQADMIHLVCHAQFRGDSPVFSALHLADGPVTADEIGTLRLTGAHVVLSACETALGDHREGEELFGLPRAFLRAGAKQVLASLWPVDDEATASLMATYYQGCQNGLAPSAALQAAQRAARLVNSHPFYWAAFSMIGRG